MDGTDITMHPSNHQLNAASIDLKPIWASLLTKALEGKKSEGISIEAGARKVVLPVHANQGRCCALVFIRALHVFLQLLSNVGLGGGAPAVGAPATAGSGSAAATEA
ncbi:hypothetical protein BC826DRAFT_344153 [Russula brevipes]|nr:hypothetical protein BC826DRAFT_344153 [Russula brevipes]